MIVIGSYPIQDILGRKPRDIDLLGTVEDFKEWADGPISIDDENHAHCFQNDGTILDLEITWPGSLSQELADLVYKDPETKLDTKVVAYMASLDVLYMLKLSHRFKKNSPHFLKTRNDILKMRAAGAKIRSEHQDFYRRRMAETYSYSHPNLKRTKSEFFNPEDDFYVYDHDSIHRAVAIDGEPAYTKYAVEGQEVLSSQQKFFAAPEAVRLAGVYEETCVLALERSQIPSRFKTKPRWSFQMALEKVCTSITSGWFREYAWENYEAVMALYKERGEDDYIRRLLKNKSMLKPYEGK